jgi:hypothetical protein
MDSDQLQGWYFFASNVGADQSSSYSRVQSGIPRERVTAIILTELESSCELSEEPSLLFKMIEPKTEEFICLMAELSLRIIRANAISPDIKMPRRKGLK